MIQLNKKTYEALIDADIAELKRHMPEHSLEKRHIIEVLEESKVFAYAQSERARYKELVEAATAALGSLENIRELTTSQVISNMANESMRVLGTSLENLKH